MSVCLHVECWTAAGHSVEVFFYRGFPFKRSDQPCISMPAKQILGSQLGFTSACLSQLPGAKNVANTGSADHTLDVYVAEVGAFPFLHVQDSLYINCHWFAVWGLNELLCARIVGTSLYLCPLHNEHVPSCFSAAMGAATVLRTLVPVCCTDTCKPYGTTCAHAY